MRSLRIVALLTLAAAMTATCARKPVDQRIRIVSLDFSLTDDDGKQAPAGYVFAIVQARHEAVSDRDCPYAWMDATVLDGGDRPYRPYRMTETRGRSSSTGPFGIRHETIKPHEIRAVYEVPSGVRLERILIGEKHLLPPSHSTVKRAGEPQTPGIGL